MEKEKFMAGKKESFNQFLELYKDMVLQEENRNIDKKFIDSYFENFFESIYQQGSRDADTRTIEILQDLK